MHFPSCGNVHSHFFPCLRARGPRAGGRGRTVLQEGPSRGTGPPSVCLWPLSASGRARRLDDVFFSLLLCFSFPNSLWLRRAIISNAIQRADVCANFSLYKKTERGRP